VLCCAVPKKQTLLVCTAQRYAGMEAPLPVDFVDNQTETKLKRTETKPSEPTLVHMVTDTDTDTDTDSLPQILS